MEEDEEKRAVGLQSKTPIFLFKLTQIRCTDGGLEGDFFFFLHLFLFGS